MVLARNTYRFSLLLVGYAIASGLDDIGAYDAEGIALLGLGLGGFALLAGTISHYGAGADEGSGAGPDGPGGRDTRNRGGDGGGGPADGGEPDGDTDDEGAGEDAPARRPSVYGPWP
jgi:hypothetical protein